MLLAVLLPLLLLQLPLPPLQLPLPLLLIMFNMIMKLTGVALALAKMIIKLAHKSKTYETRFEFDAISFILAHCAPQWGRRQEMPPPKTPKSFAYATPRKKITERTED